MRKPRGFTLLELLLASVLLAVLMVGVMSVITNVVQPAQAVAQQPNEASQGSATQSDAPKMLADLLREDLAQALTIDSTDSAIVFTSFGGLDPLTHERTGRPVRVRYGIEQIAGRPWVVRDERAMDAEQPMPPVRELVVTGVTRFELESPPLAPPGAVSAIQVQSDRRADNAALSEQAEPPVDAVWHLRIWAGERVEPGLERALVLRRSLAK